MTVDIYLQLPGIPGEALDRDHKDWIELTSATWGVEQSGRPAGGAGSGAGRSTQHPLVVSAPTSTATPLIFEAVTKGLHLPTATLEVVRAAQGRGAVAIRWEFEDVRVFRLDISGAAPGFDDQFELVARRERLTVFGADPRGAAAQPMSRGWDFGTRKGW